LQEFQEFQKKNWIPSCAGMADKKQGMTQKPLFVRVLEKIWGQALLFVLH